MICRLPKRYELLGVLAFFLYFFAVLGLGMVVTKRWGKEWGGPIGTSGMTVGVFIGWIVYLMAYFEMRRLPDKPWRSEKRGR